MRTYRQIRRDHKALAGLGFYGLNTNAQMISGQPYVFHFKYGGAGIAPGMDAISQTVAADSNFLNPVATAESGGVQVQFTYAGQGSTIGAAAGEMQDVINNWSLMGFWNGLYFVAAEGGSADAPTTPPGQNESSFFSGSTLGNTLLGAGIGGALAIVGVGILAYKLLSD